MKKTMTFVLAILLVMSLSVPVYAVLGNSESAAVIEIDELDNNLSLLLVSSTCDKLVTYYQEDIANMEQDSVEIFVESEKALPDAIPAGMVVQSYFYVDICDSCEENTVEFQSGTKGDVLVKQFIDGEWKECKYSVTEDGTVAVENVVDGPIVFMERVVIVEVLPGEPDDSSSLSPSASEDDLTPGFTYTTCTQVKKYTAEKVDTLAADQAAVFVEAKDALADVVPEGMAARYFFYIDICDVCQESTLVLRLDQYDDFVIMQYIDGEWVELEYTLNDSGTVTVSGVVAAPMAIHVSK